MVSIFSKVKNVERPLDAGHFACGDTDSELRVECASDNQDAVIAAVLDRALVDGEDAGQGVVDGIDGRHPGIACQREGAGAKKVRLDSVEPPFTGSGKLCGITAEAVGEIAGYAAGKFGHMHAKFQVFARLDRQPGGDPLGDGGFLVAVDSAEKRNRRGAERGDHHHYDHKSKSLGLRGPRGGMRGIGHAVHAGFTLVEMLVYFTILSVVATGVYTLVDYIQQTNTRIINTVRVTEQADEASAFLRAYVQNAEAILTDDIAAGDSACLTLENRRQDTIQGSWFTGEKFYVRDADFAEFSGNDNRTISAWFWVPTTQTGRNWILHMGRHSQARRQYSLYLDDGYPILDFKNVNIRPVDTTTDLRDGSWHHIAVSMTADNASTTLQDTDFRFYIDGAEVTAEFNGTESELLFPLNTTAGNAGEGFVVGGRNANGSESYEGAIFDVRLWDVPLTTTEVAALYLARQRDMNVQALNEVLRWKLTSVPMDNVTVPDDSLSSHDGILTQIDSVLDVTGLPFSTTEEERVGRAFAMYDTDGDGRYATWFNDEVAISGLTTPCPNSPLGVAGWVEVSDDVFVTDSDGFFSTVNDNPRDVSFNYGFAAANDEAFAREREAVRTRLGINQVFRNEALCRHGHDVSFLTPPSCSDNLTVAYAWIDSGYDNTSDSLVIVGSTGAEDGVETVYSDIPFVDNMTARWDPRTGVMTFRRTDNGTVQNEQWELAMNSVGFKPNSDNYRTNKLLKFSIGRLSFEIDGIDHFYNFFPERPSSWDDALAAASADNNSFCGIQGYLATVTSAEENAFLADRFINADGTWPKGYLGGYDNDSDNDVHHWMWAAPSPEAGQRFWWGLGTNGRPIREDNTVAGTIETNSSNWESVRVDLTPGDGNDSDLKHHQVNTTAPISLRFSNWSAGDEVSSGDKTSCGPNPASTDCEPNNSGNREQWVQITGGVGHGLWNDMIVDQTCSSSIYAVCGYYEEWSSDNASIRLVDEVELDLSNFREFCQTS